MKRVLTDRAIALLSLAIMPFVLITASGATSFVCSRKIPDRVPPKASLTLTTTIVGQKLCAGDAEVSTAQMKLRLHYVNSGSTPIILYKGSTIVSSLEISRTIIDALAGRRELILQTTTVTSKSQIDTSRLRDSFVILEAGSSFDTETDVAIPFTTSKGNLIPGTVGIGSHVLQVRALTYLTHQSDAQGRRWQRISSFRVDVSVRCAKYINAIITGVGKYIFYGHYGKIDPNDKRLDNCIQYRTR